MHRFVLSACATLLLTLSTQAFGEMPHMALSAGFHRIDAEVAADQQNRMQGLMQRSSMGTNQGMLFVFPQKDQHCMWMRNTLIPLSVAFIDAEGRIINIEEMKPKTETNHCAKAPAAFALEMNAGWFASKGLKPGLKIGGLEQAPAPR